MSVLESSLNTSVLKVSFQEKTVSPVSHLRSCFMASAAPSKPAAQATTTTTMLQLRSRRFIFCNHHNKIFYSAQPGTIRHRCLRDHSVACKAPGNFQQKAIAGTCACTLHAVPAIEQCVVRVCDHIQHLGDAVKAYQSSHAQNRNKLVLETSSTNTSKTSKKKKKGSEKASEKEAEKASEKKEDFVSSMNIEQVRVMHDSHNNSFFKKVASGTRPEKLKGTFLNDLIVASLLPQLVVTNKIKWESRGKSVTKDANIKTTLDVPVYQFDAIHADELPKFKDILDKLK